MTRLVLAEDDLLVREGLQRLVESDDILTVVAAYATADEVLDHLDTDEPDVVITDIRMPPAWSDKGLVLSHALSERAPETAVILLSQIASAEYAGRIFTPSAARRAYLLKERVVDGAVLRHVIDEVSAGRSYVDPDIVVTLVANRRETPSPLDDLTPREREVLALVAEGLSNAAIAQRLYVTKRSVEGYINAIFLKLSLPDEREVNRRVTAALLFLSQMKL